MLNKLPSVIKDQLHMNFKNIKQQNGGSILGTMLAASIFTIINIWKRMLSKR